VRTFSNGDAAGGSAPADRAAGEGIVSPPLISVLPPFDDRLTLRGEAVAGRPFTLAGHRALLVGDEAAGVAEAWIHPARALQALRVEGARAAEVRVTPIGIERRLEVPGGSVTERAFVPRAIAAVVFEWVADSPVELRIVWEVDLQAGWPSAAPVSGPLRWHADGRWLRVWSGGSPGEVATGDVAYILDRDPGAWTVAEATEGGPARLRVGVTVALGAGESARLAVAAPAAGDDVAATHAALRDLSGLVRARAAALAARRGAGLVVDAPDPLIAPALDWARYRLDTYLADVPGIGRVPVRGYGHAGDPAAAAGRGPVLCVAPDAALTAYGALALGQADVARDVLAFLGGCQTEGGLVPAAWPPSGAAPDPAADLDATISYLALAARYVAWTADLGFLHGQWPRVVAACRAVLDRDGALTGRASRAAAALNELANAAEALGDAGLTAELRDRAAALRAGAPHTLPAASDAADAWPGVLPPMFEGDHPAPDGMFHRWRGWLARGVEDLRGAWGDPAAWPDHAASTAAVPGVLVYRLLGVRPDAVRNRLVLRPELPATWDRFEVRGLRMGEASVALAYERAGGAHAVRLDQEEGAVPVRVIFEPALPGRRLLAASVDSQPAELDARPFRGRVRVPLQVVLDHERSIELDVE